MVWLWVGSGVLAAVLIGLLVGTFLWKPSPGSTKLTQHATRTQKARLVLGHTTWCPKCKKVLPVFQKLQQKHGRDRVVIKDAEKAEAWMAQNKLTKIPAMGVMRPDGMLVARHFNITESSIVAFAKQHHVW
jgi:thiol-disulfide isomerase/thioredoxin